MLNLQKKESFGPAPMFQPGECILTCHYSQKKISLEPDALLLKSTQFVAIINRRKINDRAKFPR